MPSERKRIHNVAPEKVAPLIDRAKEALGEKLGKTATDGDLAVLLHLRRPETIGRWRKHGCAPAKAKRLGDIATGRFTLAPADGTGASGVTLLAESAKDISTVHFQIGFQLAGFDARKLVIPGNEKSLKVYMDAVERLASQALDTARGLSPPDSGAKRASEG